jgi:hypothetical protein
MADPQAIERELREYLDKESNIRDTDKLAYLMAIMNKHFGLDKIDHIVTYYDLDHIISEAKASFASTSTPMSLTGRDLYPAQMTHALVLKSFVMYLNANKLLKKLVRFDHTEKK